MSSRLASTLPTAAHDVLGIEQRDTCTLCAAPRGIVGYSDPMTGITREMCRSCGMDRAVPRRVMPPAERPAMRSRGRVLLKVIRTREEIEAALWAAVTDTPQCLGTIRRVAAVPHTLAAQWIERAVCDGRVARTFQVMERQKGTTTAYARVAR